MVIPHHRFKELAALYRDKYKEEITLYALKFTYLNLLQGVKTALAQKLEQNFNCDFLNHGAGIIGNYEIVEPEPEPPKIERIRGIDYSDYALFDLILHPDENKHSKRDTYKHAISQDKKYAVLFCQKHGDMVHQGYMHKRNGITTRYQGCCVVCEVDLRARAKNTEGELKEERKKQIIEFNNAYLASIGRKARGGNPSQELRNNPPHTKEEQN